MQDLVFLQDQFPGISIPGYFLQPFNTHFLQIILNINLTVPADYIYWGGGQCTWCIGWMPEGSLGFNSWEGQDIFSASVFRLALGSTWPPMQWVLGLMWSLNLHLVPWLRMSGAAPSPPSMLSRCAQG